MTDDEMIEYVKKGCNRFIRMYPREGVDLFQCAALAATRARERGMEGGAMMLCITGACKDYLAQMAAVHTRSDTEISVQTYIEDTVEREIRDWDRELDDMINDLVDDRQRDWMIEQDKRIMKMVAEGFLYKEIAITLGKTEICIKKRIRAIRDSLIERGINAHAVCVH